MRLFWKIREAQIHVLYSNIRLALRNLDIEPIHKIQMKVVSFSRSVCISNFAHLFERLVVCLLGPVNWIEGPYMLYMCSLVQDIYE